MLGYELVGRNVPCGHGTDENTDLELEHGQDLSCGFG